MQAFVVLVSIAIVQSYEIPTNNNVVKDVEESTIGLISSTTKSEGGIIDVDFDIDLFSELMRSRKKFEFDSSFDFDSIERVLISHSSIGVDKSNSSLYENGNDGLGSEAPPFIVLRDHVTNRLVDPNILLCRFLTREGEKIQDLNHLKVTFEKSKRASSTTNSCLLQTPDDNTACSDYDSIEEFEELHLYKIPNGRVFIYTPTFYAKCDKQTYR
jgi:hypothetical protein